MTFPAFNLTMLGSLSDEYEAFGKNYPSTFWNHKLYKSITEALLVAHYFEKMKEWDAVEKSFNIIFETK